MVDLVTAIPGCSQQFSHTDDAKHFSLSSVSQKFCNVAYNNGCFICIGVSLKQVLNKVRTHQQLWISSSSPSVSSGGKQFKFLL